MNVGTQGPGVLSLSCVMVRHVTNTRTTTIFNQCGWLTPQTQTYTHSHQTNMNQQQVVCNTIEWHISWHIYSECVGMLVLLLFFFF